ERAAGGRAAADGAALARRPRPERGPGGHRAPAPRLRRAARRRPGMVTIRAVRVVPFAIPLRQPLATGFGSVALRRGFVVALSDADGREGIGEATPHPAAPPSALAEVGAELERVAQQLVGTDASWLLTATSHLGRATRSALDMAAHDLL